VTHCLKADHVTDWPKLIKTVHNWHKLPHCEEAVSPHYD